MLGLPRREKTEQIVKGHSKITITITITITATYREGNFVVQLKVAPWWPTFHAVALLHVPC